MKTLTGDELTDKLTTLAAMVISAPYNEKGAKALIEVLPDEMLTPFIAGLDKLTIWAMEWQANKPNDRKDA